MTSFSTLSLSALDSAADVVDAAEAALARLDTAMSAETDPAMLLELADSRAALRAFLAINRYTEAGGRDVLACLGVYAASAR
jgi:hypothetical protein